MNSKYELSDEIKKAFCDKMSEMMHMLRKSISLSQTELGHLAGISRQTVSEIERGEYKMSWNQFYSFMVVFSLNPKSRAKLKEEGCDMKCVSMFVTQAEKKTAVKYKGRSAKNRGGGAAEKRREKTF